MDEYNWFVDNLGPPGIKRLYRNSDRNFSKPCMSSTKIKFYYVIPFFMIDVLV